MALFHSFFDDRVLFHCTTSYLPVPLSMDILRCFYVIGFVNGAAMNTGVHISFWDRVLSNTWMWFVNLYGLILAKVWFNILPHVLWLSTTYSVQFSHSVMSDSATPWIAALQASLSITNSQSSLKLMCIKSVMPSSHLILCRSFRLLPPIPPSIRVFSNRSAPPIRWPKYWSFSFSISLSNDYSVLISFRIDWFDLFAVQGTLKSILQHHSLKASILQRSAFFTVDCICSGIIDREHRMKDELERK